MSSISGIESNPLSSLRRAVLGAGFDFLVMVCIKEVDFLFFLESKFLVKRMGYLILTEKERGENSNRKVIFLRLNKNFNG